MQQTIAFNRYWWYRPEFRPGDAACTEEIDGFHPVELPHTNVELPFNCFDEGKSQLICCYKKKFQLPDRFRGKEIFLDFEAVMLACEVYLNGHRIAEHAGGFLPFSVELTPWLVPGENVLVVRVDSTERPDIPPYGKVVDFLTYGGIYREVHLRCADALRLERGLLRCPDPLAEQKTLICRYEVTSPAAGDSTLTVELAPRTSSQTVLARTSCTVSLQPGSNVCEIRLESLRDIRLWDLDTPNLYLMQATLQMGELTDCIRLVYGFRQARFETDGFYLNGKKCKLIGLNRHQSWPYNGYAMPRRIQRRDVEIIRKELGCNMVRSSHYPPSRHFLDACDAMGLLVFEEMPGWQHIGNAVWQERACEDVREMILRDGNRPSVVIWGVRINESPDCTELYRRTNQIAHELDPTRQTGGVRYITHSELLEDVYTYNDFTLDGGETVFRSQQDTTGLDHPVPLLVTESNGHMFPTKIYDQEARAVEQAMRHLRVMEAGLAREDLCGELSWCAFDYNTHSCFGSGDKVCYHGVCDMFRNPKYAAYAYISQNDPKIQPVLEPITAASRGERDGGGTVPFVVLTNCDAVRVTKNGNLVGDFLPDRKAFPHLAHPPVTISHLMEQDLDFGLKKADTRAFRQFLIEKVTTGTLVSMQPQDLAFVARMAAKNNLSIKQLYGTAVRAAGGWGETANNLLLEGIVNGQVVIQRQIGEETFYAALLAAPDDPVLVSSDDTYDATRIALRAVDSNGNLLRFVQDCVEVTISGPARVMGPMRFPLSGGVSAFWIRTIGRPGTVVLTIQGMYHQTSCTVAVVE